MDRTEKIFLAGIGTLAAVCVALLAFLAAC